MPKYQLYTVAELSSFDALRGYVGKSDSVCVSVAGTGGLFAFDPTDTTTADDAADTIVGNDGRRWKRVTPSTSGLTSAVAAAQTAQTAAETAETNAETAQAAAEAARDSVIAAASIYADTTAGLAATSSGGYFWVPSAVAGEAYILYKDNAGVAEEVDRLPNAQFLSLIASIDETFEDVNTPTLSSTGATIYASSTFCGFGGQAGTPQNFNRVNFYIYPFDAADLPANVRVRVYQTDRTGSLLADSGSVALSGVAVNTLQKVQVDLPSTVANAGDGAIWIEWIADGKTGTRGASVAATYTGAPKSRYSTNQSLAAPNSTEMGTSADIYFETVLTETQAVPTDDFVARMSDGLAASSSHVDALTTALTPEILIPGNLNKLISASINLPATIYAAVGREKNIYFDGCVQTNAPGGVGAVDIDVTCTKGTHEGRRWVYTPVSGDVGSVAITITVRFQEVTLATYSGTLVTVATATGSAATRQLLVIGDSTSDITYSASWQPELLRLGAAQGPAFTFVGSMSGSGNDSTGVSRAVKNEARSGKTANFFYTDATSPFVFTGAFNFAQYQTTNSITLAADDWVIFALGINDVFSQPNDVNLAAALNTYIAAIDAMIANIQSTVSGVRIGIMVTIPPAGDGFGMEDAQDAFGAGYTSGQYARRYAINRNGLIARQISEYGGRTAEDIYLIAGNACIDTIYGFPTTTVAANARTSTTVTKMANAVHPSSSGYYQIADEVFCCLKGQE